MFSGRLWMGSYWEPNLAPCARRWGPSVPGTPGAPDAPRAPRAATSWVIFVGPASIFLEEIAPDRVDGKSAGASRVKSQTDPEAVRKTTNDHHT